MHYINQYLRIYAKSVGGAPLQRIVSTMLQPFHAPQCTVLASDPHLRKLESVLMMVSVMGLVLKTTFKEFILERLPVLEQLELFNDGSQEFAQMKVLFSH